MLRRSERKVSNRKTKEEPKPVEKKMRDEKSIKNRLRNNKVKIQNSPIKKKPISKIKNKNKNKNKIKIEDDLHSNTANPTNTPQSSIFSQKIQFQKPISKKILDPLFNDILGEPLEQSIDYLSNQNPSSINKTFVHHEAIHRIGHTFSNYQGHSVIMSSQDIIDGTHYFQCYLNPFKANINPFQKSKELPSFRIGITSPNQNLGIPLGGEKSYCFKSINGDCLSNREVISQCLENLRVQPNDTVGVLLHLETPHRGFEDGEGYVNEANYMSLFVNGRQVHRIKKLIQARYRLAISLFNQCSITLNKGPSFRYSPRDRLQKSTKIINGKLFLP